MNAALQRHAPHVARAAVLIRGGPGEHRVPTRLHPPANDYSTARQAGEVADRQTHAPPQNLGRLPAEHQSECKTRPQTMFCVATPAVTAPLMWTLGATGGRRTRPCDSHMQAGGGGGIDTDTDPGRPLRRDKGVALHEHPAKVEREGPSAKWRWLLIRMWQPSPLRLGKLSRI